MNAPAGAPPGLRLFVATGDTAWAGRLATRCAGSGRAPEMRAGRGGAALLGALREFAPDAIIIDGRERDPAPVALLGLLAGVRNAPPALIAVEAVDEDALALVRAGALDAFPRGGDAPLDALLEGALARHRRLRDALEGAAQFRQLLDASLAGIYLLQGNRVVYANPRMAEIFGFTPAELAALDSITPLIAPEDRPQVAENIRRRTGGAARSIRYRFRGVHKDGSTLDLEVHGVATRHGGRPAIIGTLIDLTELGEAERGVARRDALLQAMLDASPDGLVVLDPDGGVVTRNRAFARVWGGGDALLAAGGEAALRERLQALTESGDALPAQPAPAVPLELRDGRLVEREVQAFTVPDGRSGRVARYRDITARHALAFQARSGTERLHAILRHLTDVVTLLDRDMTILYESPAIERMTGHPADTLVGRAAIEFIHPEDAPAVADIFTELVKAPGESRMAVFRFRRADGGWLWLEAVGTNHVDNPAVGALLVVSRDISERIELERARAAADDRLRALVSHSGDIITLLDDAGNFLAGTPEIGMSGRMGYSPEELTGRPFARFLHPEDTGRYAETLAALRETPALPRAIEVRFCRADGRWLWLEAIATNHLENPALRAIVINSRDITGRKAMEFALRESEERFRMLVESLQLGVYVIQDGRFQYVNPAISEITGYERGELLALESIAAMTVPEDRARLLEQVRARLQGEPAAARFTVRNQRKDGRQIEIELHGGRVEYFGRPAILGTVTDITERSQMDRALRESEERLRLAQDAARIGAWNWDLHEGSVTWSERVAEIFGVPPEQFDGSYAAYLALIHPEDRAAVESAIAATLDDPQRPYHIEHRILPPGGGERWLECRGHLFCDEAGKPVRMAGTVMEVTARIEAARALRASEERFKRFMDNSPALAFIKDGHGRIKYANLRFREFHYTHGGRVDELHGPGFSERFADADRRVLERGEAVESETRITTRSGERALLSMQFPIPDGSGGRHIGVFALDVTDRRAAEEAMRRLNAELSATSAELNAILETLPSMIFLKDAKELRFVRFNRAGEELLGIPRAEMLGRSDRDFFEASQAEFFLAKDREVLAARQMLDIPEEPVTSRTLGRRWLHTRKIPILGDDGEPRYLLGISEDITEFKRVESALRESEARFRALVQNAHDSVLLVDAEGIIRYASPAIERLTGWPPEAPLGKHIRHFFPPGEAAAADLQFARILAAPGQTLTLDANLQRRDGRVRQTETVATNLLHDPAIRGIIINARDVTERRVAEEWLARTLQRLRLHFERTPLAVIEWSLDRKIQAWNPAAQRIFGHNAADVEGLGMACLCSEAERADAEAMLERLYEDPTSREAPVLRHLTADRRLIHCQWFNTPLVGEDGRVFAVASLVEDVSELVRTRRELEEFIFTTAHDLKAPLLSVKAFAELALRGAGLDSGVAQPLTRVIANAARMERLVSGVLEYARLGHRQPQERWLDMDESARQIILPLIPAGDPVALDFPPPAPDRLQILVDPHDLDRILSNFISNSIAYRHPDRPLRISVGMTRGRGEHAGMLAMFFADNGRGIPPEQHELAFRLFSRLGGSDSPGGHGIGLAVVKRLVEDYGGRITVESLAEGVRFNVWLPLSRYRRASGKPV